ncbi:ABC transporter permease [Enterococcus faecalis]|uniref:ABC transporter permease n=1 Tax=Enterococcus faecalis TaxID=1351 RepID=UPI001573B1EB|nr:ABC transporter permease [Enterococcus faecalis]HEL9058994.1 ABC transporter permease [Listeria monocytogenes]EHB5054277.1 ABC transporter permease [Enterococcus faecalis]EHF1810588.1 ABC transporter permease [Enterococcus faecalis]EJX8809621.1 ABC transporter permease [Enterococcus faecalis]MCD5259534.1 ABC transporter permease [Enterococcus faecalis]
MLDLLICEFEKLKRRKFVLLTILAAFLFPVPLTYFMVQDKMDFSQLFRANVLMGILLLLPIVLGIIASILFLSERDNDTLKNILTIPVSKSKLLAAKLGVLFILGVFYTMAGLGATLIGGILTGKVTHLPLYIGVSIVLGLTVMIATLPIVIIIVASNKSYVFSIIVSVVYSIIGFSICMLFASAPDTVNDFAMIVPVSNILKWYLGIVPMEEGLSYVLPYTISTPVFISIMGFYLLVFGAIASFFYKRVEY